MQFVQLRPAFHICKRNGYGYYSNSFFTTISLEAFLAQRTGIAGRQADDPRSPPNLHALHMPLRATMNLKQQPGRYALGSQHQCYPVAPGR